MYKSDVQKHYITDIKQVKDEGHHNIKKTKTRTADTKQKPLLLTPHVSMRNKELSLIANYIHELLYHVALKTHITSL